MIHPAIGIPPCLWNPYLNVRPLFGWEEVAVNTWEMTMRHNPSISCVTHCIMLSANHICIPVYHIYIYINIHVKGYGTLIESYGSRCVLGLACSGGKINHSSSAKHGIRAKLLLPLVADPGHLSGWYFEAPHWAHEFPNSSA